MYEKTTFPNGLRLLTSSMPQTRSVSISFYFGAGSRYETPVQAGISHFLEHILFKGTVKRPRPEDVSGAIENLGGIHNASTDRELTVYWCKVARPHFTIGMDVLQDMIQHSLFQPEEIEKERKVIIEELNAVQDSPPELAGLLIDQTMWPDQPLGRDVGGTRESVGGITRDMMMDYMSRQYGPDNVVVSVAGDVTHQEVVDILDAGIADWKPGKPTPYIPAVSGQSGPRVSLINRKTEQAHLCLALPGISSFHPDRYVLSMLSTAFGEGSTSRLFLEVRERRGLAYDVHSFPVHYLDTGSFSVYAGVDPKNAQETIKVVIDQLLALREGLSEAELSKVRELAKGRMLLRMEDTRAVASWMGGQEVLLGSVKTVDEVVEQLDRVTVDDVRRVARDLIDPQCLNLAVVGPFRSDKPFYRLLKG